jgi:hypothetical protein
VTHVDVVKRPDGWAAVTDGHKVAGAATKAEAVRAAAARARESADDVVVTIHRRDGSVQEQRTYRHTSGAASYPRRRVARRLSAAAIGASGFTNTSERMDEILRESLASR